MAFWRPLAVVSLLAWAAGVVAVACNLTSGLTGGPPLDAGLVVEEAASEAAADAALDRGPMDAGLDAKHDVQAEAGPCTFVDCPSGPHSVPTCADAACGLVCVGTFANCDEDASNGCEVDIATDPQNCNACGHSCQGGPCEAGACQPVTLSTNGPTHIAIDSTYIYGVNGDGTVLRLEKAGDGGDMDALASVTSYMTQGTPVPPRIAIDDAAVYWTVFSLAPQYIPPPPVMDGGPVEGGSVDSGGIPGAVLAVPIDGGEPSVLATTSGQPYAVSARAGTLFWSEGDPNVVGRDGTIHACAVTSAGEHIACGPEPPVEAAAGRVYGLLAYDGGVLFPSALFTEAGTSTGGGTITECSAQLSGCMKMVSGLTFPYSLASDPASSPVHNVYFTLFSGSGSIASCPTGTCSQMDTTLDSFQLQPRFLASDGINVYFGTLDGAIKSVPAAGGAEQILYQLHGMDPWDIAVDSTAIYWTSMPGSVDANATLRRLAK